MKWIFRWLERRREARATHDALMAAVRKLAAPREGPFVTMADLKKPSHIGANITIRTDAQGNAAGLGLLRHGVVVPMKRVGAPEPIFEVREPSGKVYQIFQSGRIEGFADGSFIANSIVILVNHLCGAIIQAQRELEKVASNSPTIEVLTSALDAAEKGANFFE